MRAGELRHRITIQQATMTRSSSGAEIPSWADVATVWAKIITTSGSESIDPVQVTAGTLTHEITIRWRSDVKETMQIIWGSRTLTIRAVVDDNLRRQLILSCDEVVS